MCIDNGFCTGEGFPLSVVVCNDKAHTEGIDIFRLIDCRYAVIDSNDNFHAHTFYFVYGIVIQTVAFRAFGDIINNVRTCFKEIGIKYGSSHNSVTVVVTIDTDFLLIFNGIV